MTRRESCLDELRAYIDATDSRAAIQLNRKLREQFTLLGHPEIPQKDDVIQTAIRLFAFLYDPTKRVEFTPLDRQAMKEPRLNAIIVKYADLFSGMEELVDLRFSL